MRQRLAKSVLSNTLYNYLGQLLIMPLTVVISVYLARKLSIGDYGTFRVLNSIGSYVLLLSYFGIPNVIQRYVPELYALESHLAIRIVVARGLKLRLGVALVVTAVGWAIIGPLSSALQAPGIVPLFPLFGLGILARAGNGVLDALLRALLMERYNNLVKAASTLAKLMALLALVGLGKGLVGVVVAFVLADLLLFALYIAKAGQEFSSKPASVREVLDDSFWKRAIRYGGFNYLSQLGGLVTDVSLDIYLVSMFLGMESTGLYSFAFDASARFLGLLPATLLIPALTSALLQHYAVSRSKDDLAFAYAFANKINLFSAFPVVVVACMLAPDIIAYVFDPQYLPATIAFVTLMAFGGLKTLAYPLQIVIVAIEKPNIFLFSRLAGLLCNLVLDLVLIPRWGILGAAVATGSTYLAVYMVQRTWVSRYVSLQFPWRTATVTFANVAITGTIVWLVRSQSSSVGRLLSAAALAGLSYSLLFFKTMPWFFSSREVSMLCAALPSWLSKPARAAFYSRP